MSVLPEGDVECLTIDLLEIIQENGGDLPVWSPGDVRITEAEICVCNCSDGCHHPYDEGGETHLVVRLW